MSGYPRFCREHQIWFAIADGCWARGAGGSEGRTSWTAKAEVADYISFVGFFVHYLIHLDKSQPPVSLSEDGLPEAGKGETASDDTLDLILGGYSYGALITTFLPSTPRLLETFATCDDDSIEAELKTQAFRLAKQWNTEAEQLPRFSRDSKEAPRVFLQTIAVGGQDSDGNTKRPSTSSRRRSLNFVRRSLSRSNVRQGRSSSRARHGAGSAQSLDIACLNTSYLLISPLLQPTSLLVSFFSSWSHTQRAGKEAEQREDKLMACPTMAIYGDRDMFTWSRKVRKWASELATMPGSKFESREITGAGHFWQEAGAERKLKHAVEGWIQSLAKRAEIRSWPH